MRSAQSKSVFLAAGAVGAILLADIAHAQVEDAADVVTAIRQSQMLSKVPISISAYSRESIDAQGIRNTNDAMRFTPGINISRNGFGTQANISIRFIMPSHSLFDWQAYGRAELGAIDGGAMNHAAAHDRHQGILSVLNGIG